MGPLIMKSQFSAARSPDAPGGVNAKTIPMAPVTKPKTVALPNLDFKNLKNLDIGQFHSWDFQWIDHPCSGHLLGRFISDPQ
jgi:hypothetical protein